MTSLDLTTTNLDFSWQSNDLVTTTTGSDPYLRIVMTVGDALNISLFPGQEHFDGVLYFFNGDNANFDVTTDLPVQTVSPTQYNPFEYFVSIPPPDPAITKIPIAALQATAPVSSASIGIEIGFYGTIAITVVNSADLFTNGDDYVDFRSNLTPSQALAVFRGAIIYADTSTGADTINLPDVANYPDLSWDPNQTFFVANGNDTIYGGDGNNKIGLGAGTDTVNLQGNGASATITGADGNYTLNLGASVSDLGIYKISLGNGTDKINIEGNGTNTTIAGANGNYTISIGATYTDSSKYTTSLGAGDYTVNIQGSGISKITGADGQYSFSYVGTGQDTITISGNDAQTSLFADGGTHNIKLAGGPAIIELIDGAEATITGTGGSGNAVVLDGGTISALSVCPKSS
jgi:hypothetical protein